MDAVNGGQGNLEGTAAEPGPTGAGTGPGAAGRGAGLEAAGSGAGLEAAGSGAGLEAAGDGSGAGLRVSDRERDAVVQRVQAAFAEGRLDDTEFDERMRAALTARTRGDLDVLLTDLPAETAAPGPAPAAAGRGPGGSRSR